MQNHYDILIVGAGAAGCAFGHHIDVNRFDSLLIDAGSLPRKKTCSGILVREAQAYFADQLLPDSIFSTPTHLDLCYVDLDNQLVSHQRKAFWNTDRARLDRWMLEGVKARGIEVEDSTRLLSVDRRSDGILDVLLRTSRGIERLSTRYLIGCDGVNSGVRAALHIPANDRYLALKVRIPEVSLPSAYFIFAKAISDAYSWLIPKSEELELGLVAPAHQARASLRLLESEVGRLFGISGSGSVEAFPVGRLASIGSTHLGRGRVFLCGEAAGLISPSSAEGISYALESGRTCARAINSLSSPLEEYASGSADLLERLAVKCIKARVISNPSRRASLFAPLGDPAFGAQLAGYG